MNWIALPSVLFTLLLWPSALLADPAQRLISTDAATTELLIALQADHDLVAVDVTSQLPKGYRPLPNIGYHRQLSAEGLLSLSPSAVIGSEHMGPPEVITALEAAEVSLLQLDSANTIAELQNNIRLLAATVDAKPQGQALIAQLDDQSSALQQAPLKGLRIAFLLSLEPSKLRLAGHGTSAHAFIKLLGAEPVGDFPNYRNVSAESLLSLNPDVLLVAGSNLDTAVEDLLAANPVLRHSPAVQNNRALAIDGSALVAGLSVRAVDQARTLSAALHPQP